MGGYDFREARNRCQRKLIVKEKLLAEALDTLGELVEEISNWEDDVRQVIQILIEHGIDFGRAKTIIAKANKESE